MNSERRAIILKLSKALLKIGALQFGTFQLSDGRYSPFYLDMSSLPSFPSVFSMCVRIMIETAEKLRFEAVCGVPFKGLPLASVFAFSLKKPLIYIRKDGTSRRNVEGSVAAGSEVVIIDDVASSGLTLSDAAMKVRDEGYKVSKALVLVDRLDGAKERLRESKVVLISVASILEISDVLKRYDILSDEQYRAIVREKKTQMKKINKP